MAAIFKWTCAVVVVVLACIPALMFALCEMHFARSLRGTFPFMTSPSSHGYSYAEIPDLAGKTALVTGANAGLGYATAAALASQGATTVLACRNLAKCEAAVASIRALPGVARGELVTAATLDLSSLSAVSVFADEFKRTHDQLHSLILNAGVMHPPYTLSADGIELQWAVNHVAHQHLTQELLPLLEASSPATITVVSSSGHFAPKVPVELMLDAAALSDPDGYDKVGHYGTSKLGNVLMARQLASRLGPDSDVFVNSLNPGGVSTTLGRHHSEGLMYYIMSAVNSVTWTPETAALTQLYTATSPEIVERRLTGAYFSPIARICEPSAAGSNATLAALLWDSTARLIDEKLGR